jgi:adenylylsulfate kinase-like enzyme
VDDPYEPPVDPEVTLDTVNYSAEDNARTIIAFLEKQGFLQQIKSGNLVKEMVLLGK